jgi:hypothetical protein
LALFKLANELPAQLGAEHIFVDFDKRFRWLH